MKKYQLIFDGDSIIGEIFDEETFRALLISQLHVNEILSYEVLNELDLCSLIIIIEVEMSCEVRIMEVL